MYKITNLPGRVINFSRRALTSSYVKNATYPGCVTANIFQFLNKVGQG